MQQFRPSNFGRRSEKHQFPGFKDMDSFLNSGNSKGQKLTKGAINSRSYEPRNKLTPLVQGAKDLRSASAELLPLVQQNPLLSQSESTHDTNTLLPRAPNLKLAPPLDPHAANQYDDDESEPLQELDSTSQHIASPNPPFDSKLPPLTKSSSKKKRKLNSANDLQPHKHTNQSKKPEINQRKRAKKSKLLPQDGSLLPHQTILYIFTFLPSEFLISKVRHIDQYWRRKIRKSRKMWKLAWEQFVHQHQENFLPAASNQTKWELMLSHNAIDITTWKGTVISEQECINNKFNKYGSLMRCFEMNPSLRFLLHWIWFLAEVSDRIEITLNRKDLGCEGGMNYYERFSTFLFIKGDDFYATITTRNSHLPEHAPQQRPAEAADDAPV